MPNIRFLLFLQYLSAYFLRFLVDTHHEIIQSIRTHFSHIENDFHPSEPNQISNLWESLWWGYILTACEFSVYIIKIMIQSRGFWICILSLETKLQSLFQICHQLSMCISYRIYHLFSRRHLCSHLPIVLEEYLYIVHKCNKLHYKLLSLYPNLPNCNPKPARNIKPPIPGVLYFWIFLETSRETRMIQLLWR